MEVWRARAAVLGCACAWCALRARAKALVCVVILRMRAPPTHTLRAAQPRCSWLGPFAALNGWVGVEQFGRQPHGFIVEAMQALHNEVHPNGGVGAGKACLSKDVAGGLPLLVATL